jgi:hypothetical protein
LSACATEVQLEQPAPAASAAPSDGEAIVASAQTTATTGVTTWIVTRDDQMAVVQGLDSARAVLSETTFNPVAGASNGIETTLRASLHSSSAGVDADLGHARERRRVIGSGGIASNRVNADNGGGWNVDLTAVTHRSGGTLLPTRTV